MSTPLRALLWDVDGTLAETERDGHRVAFNEAFASLGLPWRWGEEHYGRLLRITGGRERLLADMQGRGDAPVLVDEREALARELHRRKNAFYAALVRDGGIRLRGGVRELVEEAHGAGLLQAIVSTTSRGNAEALLVRHFRAQGSQRFAVMVCGEDVAAKKPDPEAYHRALAALGIDPLQAVAIEDSPGGVAAARAADVPVLVTRSAYFPVDTVEGAIAIGPGLDRREGWTPPCSGAGAAAPADTGPHEPAGRPSGVAAPGPVTLADLQRWHARMELVSHFA